MAIEGTNISPEIPEGTLKITVTNTTPQELFRIYQTLATIFDQGLLNMRNGKAILHFDDHGSLRGVDKDVSSWRDGKEVVTRVAMHESIVVELLGK